MFQLDGEGGVMKSQGSEIYAFLSEAFIYLKEKRREKEKGANSH